MATQGFNAATRFVGLPRLHFASFVVFDAKCLKRPLSKLVLECAIDGPIAPFLRDLDRHRDLSRVFRHCQEYARAENTLQYLRAHVQKPHLYHVGTPYQSAASILSDIRQRDDFDQRDEDLRLRTPSEKRHRQLRAANVFRSADNAFRISIPSPAELIRPSEQLARLSRAFFMCV